MARAMRIKSTGVVDVCRSRFADSCLALDPGDSRGRTLLKEDSMVARSECRQNFERWSLLDLLAVRSGSVGHHRRLHGEGQGARSLVGRARVRRVFKLAGEA